MTNAIDNEKLREAMTVSMIYKHPKVMHPTHVGDSHKVMFTP